MTGIVERLMTRAQSARAEGRATALGDALHFEEAAKIIALAIQLRTAQRNYFADRRSRAKLDIAIRLEGAFDSAIEKAMHQEEAQGDFF